MPEGDTVHLAAARLDRALSGRVLTRTEFRVPRLATADLAGRRVDAVEARGKHLLFRFDAPVVLHTHFAMDGAWHLYRHDERWRAPAFAARCVLETQDTVAVGFRLAITELIGPERERELLAALGPDVLGPDWDAAEVVRRMRSRPDRAIGDVLLDQGVVAGPGNVYRCEVCFLRGLDPWTPVGEVADLEGIVSLLKRLMEANRATGRQVTTGDLRAGGGRWVYGRFGEPCLRCGVRIARVGAPPGERVTYWCPACQPARPQLSARGAPGPPASL